MKEVTGVLRMALLNDVLRPPPRVPRSERVQADYPVEDAGSCRVPRVEEARRYRHVRGDFVFVAGRDRGKQFFNRIFV